MPFAQLGLRPNSCAPSQGKYCERTFRCCPCPPSNAGPIYHPPSLSMRRSAGANPRLGKRPAPAVQTVTPSGATAARFRPREMHRPARASGGRGAAPDTPREIRV